MNRALRDVIPVVPSEYLQGTCYPPLGVKGKEKILVVRVNRWTDDLDGPILAIVNTRENPDKSVSSRYFRQIRHEGEYLRTFDENGVPFWPSYGSAAVALVALLDSCPERIDDIEIGGGARALREMIASRFEAIEQGRLHLAGKYLYDRIVDLPAGLVLGRYVGRTASFVIHAPLPGDIFIIDAHQGSIAGILESRPGGWAISRKGKLGKYRFKTIESAVIGLIKACIDDLSISGHETIHLAGILEALRKRKMDLKKGLANDDFDAGVFNRPSRSL